MIMADRFAADPAKRYSLPTRWALFFFGLWIMTVGIALMVHAALGITPISTVPVAVAAAVPLSFGVLTIFLNLGFVVLQILILRRQFQLFQLWQLLVAVFFGVMCDVSLAMTGFLNPGSYPAQLLLMLAGMVLISLGVFTQVLPRILYAPGEGIVVAITIATGWKFGTVKQIFDWTLVLIAAAFSLLVIGNLVGVREGTVAAAFAVGGLTKLYQRWYDAAVRRRIDL